MSNMSCFLCLVLLMAVGSSKGKENVTNAIDTQSTIPTTLTSEGTTIPTAANSPKQSEVQKHTSIRTSALNSTPNKGSTESKVICATKSTETDDCLFSLKNEKHMLMKLVIASLLLACLVLLICTLVLSCKVCHLKSHLSNSYVVRDNGDLYPTQSKGFTRAKPDSVEAEQETCPMINMTSKPEEDGAGTVKKEEDREAGAAAKQDGDHACADEAEENKKPAAETAATQEDKVPEQIAVEKEDAV